jgi:hypothetical protein
MPITHPKPPEGGAEIASSSINEILRSQATSSARILSDARTEDMALAEPHQAYVVGLADIASGKLLEAARLVSWRYLVIQEPNAVAEVELSAGADAAKREFLGLHQGPFANGTLEALRIAEDLPEIKKKPFELRFLKIPALYFAALWLARPKEDIIIPLHEPPAGLKANQPYSEKEILKALKSPAAQTQQFDQRFQKAQGKSPK